LLLDDGGKQNTSEPQLTKINAGSVKTVKSYDVDGCTLDLVAVLMTSM
jgi:hypothetical protein